MYLFLQCEIFYSVFCTEVPHPVYPSASGNINGNA